MASSSALNLSNCSLCLHRLTDVVTIPCGHVYCKGCTEGFVSEYGNTGKYSCTQCGQSFTQSPEQDEQVDEVVRRLMKTSLQADHSMASNAGPEDVACDICTGPKHKAIKSCLVCLASYCDDHLKLHNDLNTRTPHTLVDTTGQLQGMTCPLHNKLLEVYCRTDKQCLCCLCMLDNHKGHDTISAAAGRAEKEEETKKSKQRITERQEQLKELRAAKTTLRDMALATEEESERLFKELIQGIKSSHSEMKALIRAQERAELERVEDLLIRLEREIGELKRSDAELEQLSHTQNHIHFLQAAQSLYLLPGSADVPALAVNPQFSFGEVIKSITELKVQIEDIWQREIKTISSGVKKDKIVVPSEPKTREDFLQYFVPLSLDPNTAHKNLRLSEENRAVSCDLEPQPYPDSPERFDWWAQVLSREALSGRCYWEAQWTGLYGADIAVSYGDISRKGEGDNCGFGYNKQCWSLDCSISRYAFVHNNEETEISVPTSHRIGVYLNYRAGLLSFYSVSEDSMTLLHRVETRFTQPVNAGFGLYGGSTAKICQPGKEAQKQTNTEKTKRVTYVKNGEHKRRMCSIRYEARQKRK
ncbi:hypothetical protein AOLI_G00155710 [Acnodon oligacanthus]